MDKRTFLKFGLGVAGAGFTASTLAYAGSAGKEKAFPTSARLADITGTVAPITDDERRARVDKAQKLMKEHDIAALIIEPGASMDYFSGIQWWRSERLTALVIPQSGDVGVVTPFFEKPSVEETLKIAGDVKVWQEHESPFEQVAAILKARGVTSGKIGFENTVRYFVLDGLMKALPGFSHVPAEPVVLGCRMYKSSHELRLMHKANEVTLMAYQHVWESLEEGMSQADVKAMMNDAQQKLGGQSTWCLALFNEASAYPHGTRQSQIIEKGSVVLLDSGCAVHGYQSDISRTFVFGKPSDKQKRIWDLVRKGQQVAFDTAKTGAPAGSIDDAVRALYKKEGFGPDYTLPGLSHRTGHGIGMEGHERVNFVHEEKMPLKKGMCFSNEPGIYLPGEFGVRLEDCLYMGKDGPHWFTEPPASLKDPIGKLAPLVI